MLLVFLGALVGFVAGMLGVGGGIVLVPVLVSLNYSPLNAVGISALAVAMIALSGTFFHYRQSDFNLRNLGVMALPCLITTQAGVLVAIYTQPALLLLLFGVLILLALVLVALKSSPIQHHTRPRILKLLLVGSVAGFLSGMFGIGGGVILVPLQVLALKFSLKSAVRNSLAIVLVASCFSAFGHAVEGTILFKDAFLIGLGGIVGARLGAGIVPNISEPLMRRLFTLLLIIVATYVFWQAFNYK